MAGQITNGPESRRPLNGTGVRRISVLAKKKMLKIGTWNVRSLLSAGKLANVIQEMERLNINVLGLSETKWPGTKTFESNNHIIFCSGGEDNKPQTYGTAIIIPKYLKNSVLNFIPFSERMAMIQLAGDKVNFNIIQVYAPTASKSDQEIEDFYSQLKQLGTSTKKHDINIVMGDFNAKVGKGKVADIIGDYGLGTRNERGDRLLQFCTEENFSIMNTWFKLPPRRLYTWKSPQDKNNNIVRNQIDYILINKRFKTSILGAQTYPGADVSSDHNPVVAKIRVKLKTLKKPQINKKPDLEKLKGNNPLGNNIKLKLNDNLKSINLTQVEPYSSDDLWQPIKNTILKVQKEELGYVKKQMKQKWMTVEILQLMEERRQHKDKDAQKYKEIQNIIRRKIKLAKENWLNNKCGEIEELIRKNDNFSLHKKLKEAANIYKQFPTTNMIDINNKIILTKTEKLKTWSNYVYNTFNDDRREPAIQFEPTGPSILKSEVENAIRQAKTGKACGPDEVFTEMLKHLNGANISTITQLFNKIYDTGIISSEWLKSVFITLPKKTSSRRCEDYRLISLMSHTLKIFLKVIQNRIKNKCEAILQKTQFGFRSGLGTREAVFCLQVLLQRCLEHQKEVYLCFIDYEKAFDTVQHQKLLEQLHQIGLDGKDIRIIKNLYWNQIAILKFENELTSEIPICRGVRQGCILSPLLFNIYSEIIFKKALEEEEIGIQVNGHWINNIRYADDTVLIAETENDLQHMVNRIRMESEPIGLKINKSKTKVMKISKKSNIINIINIKLDDVSLEQVKNYKYLGTLINENLDTEIEIKSRIEQARQSFMKWKNLLCHRSLNINTRIRTLKCYIWSILLYGVETWTIKQTTVKKLEAVEMWFYRRMLKISWTKKISNLQVLQTINKERELLTTIMNRKSRYLGHIMRNDKYQLLQLILEGKIAGKRRPGRRTTSWLKNISQWTNTSTEKLLHSALDRNAFRKLVTNIQ